MVALVAAISVTSLGGAERVVRFVESMVGGRAVVKINSSDENMVIVEEDVEKAYQTLREELGVDPVKIIMGSLEGMSFNSMTFDKMSQFAEISYSYNEENIAYFISASYKESSWGMDLEEHIKNRYQIKNRDCIIEVREYESADGGTDRFLANFSYRGLEYFLVGTMEKEKFETIIKNLYFWK